MMRRTMISMMRLRLYLLKMIIHNKIMLKKTLKVKNRQIRKESRQRKLKKLLKAKSVSKKRLSQIYPNQMQSCKGSKERMRMVHTKVE
jgi:hypothetical protein